ncbi:hypothetical protein NIIDMKKI_02060 [Mycobacterium kansasii]|uniref:PE domain-containing protein n=1 Tax=Mycobacterium kansasii TaxID=1768 RepID=A0A7G1I1S6_MYCKA|nr:hypothetical protein NIIDMKKI_02060 [Mycobacterium kansasii]
MVAAGADEVSAAVASLFSEHGQAYQVLCARAAVFHEQFVQVLTGAGGAYAGAEGLMPRRCRRWDKTCWGG